MTTRHWKLVVTEIGTPAALAEAVVEAPNWMAGIKLARGRIGEPEAIPQGASCTVAPDGRVTVFDAGRRRSYVLIPLAETGHAADAVSYPPGVYTASQVPAAPPPAPATPFAIPPAPVPTAPASGAPAARPRPKTMAYILDGPLPQPGAIGSGPMAAPTATPVAVPLTTPQPAIAQAAPAEPPRPTQGQPTVPFATGAAATSAPTAASSRAAMRRTMAFVPGQFDLPPLPTREVVVGAQAPAPTAPAAPVAAPKSLEGAPAAAPRVLFSRSAEPSEDSPLHYHLVGLHVPGERSTVEIERAMVNELARVQASIGSASEGHLVQVHAYKEPVAQPTEGAETAQLTWRGWRREANVRFPKLEDEIANQTIPGAERYPTAQGDPRLADILDAFEDVWFLATPKAGLEFVARIAEDLFEGVHVLCAGLSATGPGFVTAATRGTLAGYKVPQTLEPKGLTQLALASAGRPVLVGDASTDARLDKAIEGASTGPTLAAVAPHGGEALGYVRLARPKGGHSFSVVDAELLRAIVERLGLFLRLRGACILS